MPQVSKHLNQLERQKVPYASNFKIHSQKTTADYNHEGQLYALHSSKEIV